MIGKRTGRLPDPEVVEDGQRRCVDAEGVEVDEPNGVEDASEMARLAGDDG